MIAKFGIAGLPFTCRQLLGMGNPPSLGVDLASTGDFLEELVLCRERAGREADNVSHLARDSAIVRGFHLGLGIDWFAAYECSPGELQPSPRPLHSSKERRVGNACSSTCRCRWSP